MRRAAWLLAAALALAGCNLLRPKHPVVASLHYELGAPYQSDGVWHYPRPQFDLDETGLAVATTRTTGLTADGEVADPTALAAAHPTLPLPALVRVTNLETGLQVLVRVNDRGPPQRGRAIALTPRAITLLGGAPNGIMRVRIQAMETESRQMAGAIAGPEAAPLPVAAAPTGDVKAESLPPPPGVKLAAARSLASGPAPRATTTPARAEAAVPLRLPEQVSRVPAHPGALYVELATFSRQAAADVMSRRFAGLGAQTTTSYDAPRDSAFAVRIGPLPDVATADTVVTRLLGAGVAEPKILVD